LSGWFTTPAAGWPVTLERLQRLGEPLTESEAITDLRWHVDQRVPLPGRRELRKRWGGWSERAIRDLLADTCRWWDATKGLPPQSRGELEARVPVVQRRLIPPASHSAPTGVPQRSHPGTVKADESGASDPTALPPASHVDPTGVHARAQIHPAPSPTPSPGKPVGPGIEDAPTEISNPLLEAYERAATYWGEIVLRQIGRRPTKGPSRSSKLGGKLLAAIRRDENQVMDALRFVAESQTDRAQKLRTYDGLTVETVLRHVEEYAELWRAHEDRPTAGPSPPRRGQSTAGDGVLAEVRRRLREEAEHGDGGRGGAVLGGPRERGPVEAVGVAGGGDPIGAGLGGSAR
jgi:hypothetical protein